MQNKNMKGMKVKVSGDVQWRSSEDAQSLGFSKWKYVD